MNVKRLAVIGSGKMAKLRTRAFLSTGQASLVGVASRNISSARGFAELFNCDSYYDDYERLSSREPDAVLIEVPHEAQQNAAMWAIGSGYDVLIGGCLACSMNEALAIAKAVREKNVVLEAGYEARYKPVWERARDYMIDGTLGQLIAVTSIALWDADPWSWYYSQKESGGMPLTHMTYAFINPVRWILGDPLYVSAFANRIRLPDEGEVNEETCTANLLFKNNVICNMTAGYVKPGDTSSWMLTVLGTQGIMEIFPFEMGPGSLRVVRGPQNIERKFDGMLDPFEVQARVFLDSTNAQNNCRNKPEDAICDIQVAEAIVESARNKTTIKLEPLAVRYI
jgi:myo-inositol 2-dehydrogenase/D-chiro-inositol 1-dehydrogenase